MNMIKDCKKHGLTEFSSNKGKRCKKCMVVAVQKRRDKVKRMAVEYCGGKCQDCLTSFSYQGVYDFHHLDESIKEFSIGNRGYTKGWEKIKKELDKCILLCSNCHRIRHAKQKI